MLPKLYHIGPQVQPIYLVMSSLVLIHYTHLYYNVSFIITKDARILKWEGTRMDYAVEKNVMQALVGNNLFQHLPCKQIMLR